MKGLLLALMLLWLAALARPALATDTVYYYYTNTLHSAVVETDAQGNIVEHTTYYAPYGQVLNRSMRDGPGYTGHEEDPATGLNYMQQRYYDPQSGRFVSTDPVQPSDDGGNFNRYWYANDNPYRYTDPDGRETGATLQAIDRMTAAPYVTGGTSTGQMLNAVGDALDTANRNLAPLNAETDGGFGAAMTATTGAVRALAKLAEAGEALEGAAKGASAAERAAELAGTMGKVTQTKVTIAVTETAEGTRVVSSSEGALRPATRAALSDGEVAGKGVSGTHAEVNGVNATRKMGMTPTGTAASRPICPSCAQHLEQQGVTPLSPLKHEP